MRFKRIFVKGGNDRMKHTLPALIFSLFKLSREMVYRQQGVQVPFYGTPAEHEAQMHTEETKESEEPEMVIPKCDQHKIFKCINELILQLQSTQPEMALRLYLQAAEAMNVVPDSAHMEELGYEFVS
jgi:hypothetical protein